MPLQKHQKAIRILSEKDQICLLTIILKIYARLHGRTILPLINEIIQLFNGIFFDKAVGPCKRMFSTSSLEMCKLSHKKIANPTAFTDLMLQRTHLGIRAKPPKVTSLFLGFARVSKCVQN